MELVACHTLQFNKMGTEAKVAKLNNQNDVKSFKNKYNYRPKKKLVLEPGLTGFLVTCNFRAKNCIREAYNLLNSYADKLYGVENENKHEDSKTEDGPDEDIDIADSLKKESEEESGKGEKKIVNRRFQVVETGANNFLFIRTIPPIDPVPLGQHIAADIAENRLRKTQFLMRLVPIEAVCHISDVMKVAGRLADKHFLQQGCSFSVAYNKRFNNVMKRDDIIRDLAELIKSVNVNNRVELTNPEKTIVVEILKGLCLLTVVNNYNQYKKYNLSELAAGPKKFSPEKLRINKKTDPAKTEEKETEEKPKDNPEQEAEKENGNVSINEET